MTAQTELVDRMRALLSGEAPVREETMFGTRSFLVREKLVASALKDGGLLVRVDADRHEELLDRPGAAQAVMGPDRDMGPGWVEVAATALVGEGLASWLEVALEHNRTVTAGG
ncbi:TfoX N-terminal domain-containing protein [Georgenia satyanarayanai]|uniref:TfoX N-terminal domain-containing protein n=1 Tax=Georgenia satyanarayanai TaxID=860221 RepID=A0A2Y9C6M2_9MICO|nr:TfoX/Sxy family protein [Georgenia satyanarayanai]PYF99145.1 TfoX-like protein [Georgenia satyanarayanai]SSA43263.1 TfoX N-terminal domain-containing protein [Georgenia satyanarayanai]